jgi:hypothetical protein
MGTFLFYGLEKLEVARTGGSVCCAAATTHFMGRLLLLYLRRFSTSIMGDRGCVCALRRAIFSESSFRLPYRFFPTQAPSFSCDFRFKTSQLFEGGFSAAFVVALFVQFSSSNTSLVI